MGREQGRIDAQAISRRSLLVGAGAAVMVSAPVLAARRSVEPEKHVLQGPDGRAIELWRWAPGPAHRGTIAFSHGAASAPWKYRRLIDPWAAAGYEVLAPLHVDSEDHPRTKDFPGLASWKARIEDMRALAATIQSKRYIAAGHSYGGLTALTLGGANAVVPEGISGPLRDERVVAAVAFSPPAPVPVLITAEGYAGLAVPALIQTGTRDVPPGSADAEAWRTHLAAYDAARAGGDRYALVLDGVDHYFGGEICRAQPGPPQSAQLAQAVELSTLFLNGFGAGKGGARRALDKHLRDTGPVRLTHK